MLHVIIQKPFDEQMSCVHFNVDDERIRDVNPNLVQAVLAEGHELNFILDHFQGIPARIGQSAQQHWFGDDAKFIVANWL